MEAELQQATEAARRMLLDLSDSSSFLPLDFSSQQGPWKKTQDAPVASIFFLVNILFSTYQLLVVKVTADLGATKATFLECLLRLPPHCPVVEVSFSLEWFFSGPSSLR